MGNNTRAKFIIFWFPVILYSAIIFYASSISNVEILLPEIQFDKILHIFGYIPFGFLVARGIDSVKFSLSWKTIWLLVFLAVLLYGVSDEYHQSLVPGRSADAIDLIADTIGGIIGGYIYLHVTGRIRNH